MLLSRTVFQGWNRLDLVEEAVKAAARTFDQALIEVPDPGLLQNFTSDWTHGLKATDWLSAYHVLLAK